MQNILFTTVWVFSKRQQNNIKSAVITSANRAKYDSNLIVHTQSSDNQRCTKKNISIIKPQKRLGMHFCRKLLKELP